MSILKSLYRSSLALLTDLYELTMAYGYWKLGTHEKEAVFNLFFREHPFKGGFTVACGLSYVVDYLNLFHFDREDVEYLEKFKGNDGKPLFDREFLDYLLAIDFICDIDGVPEGTVVFPYEPLLRVRGPLIQCQIIETVLLNMINFQTLIATKSARVCMAAQGEPVLEFGLRRAQGFDGGLMASRAAYIGGCAGTSNVLAGKLFNIPVKGTHAHSWVMSFDTEIEAFMSYARAMPNNCVFLVDTYNTLDGVRKAVKAGKWLREQGHEMIGIRLDSGDLAQLSIEARKILDNAGFTRAVIIGSSDLDEHAITALKEKGATIAVWGVGTKLATGYDQPALGGVYKLVAVRQPGEPWNYRVKLSDDDIKKSIPGILQVRRYYSEEGFICDVIFDEEKGINKGADMIDPANDTAREKIPADTRYFDITVPVFRGKQVYSVPDIEEARALTQKQLSLLPSGSKLFKNPDLYPVRIEQSVYDLQSQLIRMSNEITS